MIGDEEMKRNYLFTLLILSMLLAACSGGQSTTTIEPTVAAVQVTDTMAPTLAPSSATEEPAAVPPPEEDLAMLRANPWQWVSFTNPVEQYSIDNPQNYSVSFNNDATVNIVADCNNANGSYVIAGSGITIQIGPMTLAACPEGSHSDDFVKYLGSAAIYFFKDGHLFIDLMADGGTMEFAPADTGASLQGVAWKWDSFSNPAEQYDVEQSDKYRLFFADEGLLLVFADCNTVQGKYTLDGQSMKIELGPSTLVACPGDSRSDQFLSYLTNAAVYSFQGSDLLIDLVADGGTLRFSVYDPLAALKAKNWQEVLEKTLQGCYAPGGVLLADTPQGRFLSAYGVSSTADQTPMQTTDRFQIGSNTKSFTTVLSLLLQEDGVWSLDDPLSKWLPDQAAKIKNGDQITLRMLGQNHTGIPDYADAVIGDALKGDTLDQASLEKGYTPEELVDIGVQLREPSFAPGEGWEYSTTNFILLGMAIEAATGKTLDQLYQERIFDPLGMENSYLLQGVPEVVDFARGYYTLPSGEAVDVSNWNGSQGWAGGSIVSTAEDMAKYAAGLASGSVFKDPASLEQLTAFGDGMVGPFSNYGLGVGIWSQEPLAWGHAGQTPGFQSLFAIYPEQDTQVVFFANSGSCNVYSLPQMVSVSPDLFTQKLP
jgi:D-alanyl-D-alanine carboxypeptidase